MCHSLMSSLPQDSPSGLPAVYVLLMVEVAKRWHVTETDLIEPFGLTHDMLSDPSTRIPLETINEILKLAFELTEEPGLAFYMGMQMKLSSHGFIGFAAMTADTIAQALELVERFISVRLTGIALRLERDGDKAHLYLETDIALQPLRDNAIAALMVGLGQMAQVITGQTLYGIAELTIAKPDQFEEFYYALPAQIHFERPYNRISFDAAYLDTPLIMADAVSLQLAVEQCERELVAFGHHNRFIRQVRDLIYQEQAGFRNVEQVAADLFMSERTLKRQLAQEGTTFSDILEDIRRQKAITLLQSDEQSLERIGEKLGYSDVANFNRAFKRWTGTTPGQYRKQS